MNTKFIITVLFSLLSLQPFAQEKSNVKFGKVDPGDFKLPASDSNANAVVIADIGSSEMVGNVINELRLEFKRFKRIMIVNKNGYDAADVEIPLFTNGHSTEELKDLKVVTYNLENGKVIQTKLEPTEGIFKDKVNKNIVIKKFTFPNIKEGCIIEYQYRIKSDFIFNVQPWDFQGEYPCLWSDYEVSLPEFYYFATMTQGYQPFYINTSEEKNDYYTISSIQGYQSAARGKLSINISDKRWVMKNVPPLKAESFTSTIRNHLSRVQFQLAEYRYPFIEKDYIGTWQQLCKIMLEDENFGYAIGRNNGWLDDEITIACKGSKDETEKAKNIFAYVRDRMTSTGYNSITISKSLKSVLNNKSGSESEINLLLTAMLVKAGLEANPVMLSTRSNGYAMELYPLLDKFNYIISRVKIKGEYYYLDASHSRLGFGKLEYQAYNGFALVIDKQATHLQLLSDSLLESRLTSVIIINDDKGNLTGTMKKNPGFYKSYELRDLVKQKGQAEVFNNIKKDFATDIAMSNQTIDLLDDYDDPVNIQYDFDIKTENADILYINPMFSEAWKDNPFKSSKRNYPIEMPYTIDETYLLKLDIPSGYVIDELPKPIMLKLNDNDDGFFEYVLSESDGSISLRSRIRLKRAYYMPEEYETLREFYNLIIKKHSEQIVFKKKK